jgi:dTDP-6-deoxy-L-talose 4-dehydrogenase (NAD+)
MKVGVTGAGGFIGSHVVERLLADGHDVIALDRAATAFGRLERWGDRVSRVVLDLEAAPARPLLERERPEAILHLAWYADPVDYLTSSANLGSVTATLAMVEAALAAGCRKLVMTGSGVEYAPQDRMVRETDPADPRTLYASCKHATWLVARALCAAAGAELAWARIFHLHGPGEDARRLIPWVASELQQGRAVDLTDGTQVRDHLHVADVASGLTSLLAPGAAGLYNVSSGEPVPLRRVLETVGRLVGRPELLRFGARPHRPQEIMFLAGDSSRLRATGWKPRFELEDGLENALGDGVLRYRARP